jgi:hypothetical protein
VLVADDQSIINNINNTAAEATSGTPAPLQGSPAPLQGGPTAPLQGGPGAFLQGLNAGATSMANGAQQMLASAQSGQLKFDPETGQALVQALNQHIDELNTASNHVSVISAKSPLGTTAGGTAMATFNAQVASTGPQAFAPAHQKFVDSLGSAVQAIKLAMENYAKTEGDNAGTFTAKD